MQSDTAQLSQNKPVGGVDGVPAIVNFYNNGNEEIKSLLANECDIVFECRYCRALFRSIINFTAHKRQYCKGTFGAVSANARILWEQYMDQIKQGPANEEVDDGKAKRSLMNTLNRRATDIAFPIPGHPDPLILHTYPRIGKELASDKTLIGIANRDGVTDDRVAVVFPTDPNFRHKTMKMRSRRDGILATSDTQLSPHEMACLHRILKYCPDVINENARMKCHHPDCTEFKAFSSYATFSFHIGVKHAYRVETNDLKIPCFLCNHNIKTWASYYRHYQNVHKSIREDHDNERIVELGLEGKRREYQRGRSLSPVISGAVLDEKETETSVEEQRSEESSPPVIQPIDPDSSNEDGDQGEQEESTMPILSRMGKKPFRGGRQFSSQTKEDFNPLSRCSSASSVSLELSTEPVGGKTIEEILENKFKKDVRDTVQMLVNKTEDLMGDKPISARITPLKTLSASETSRSATPISLLPKRRGGRQPAKSVLPKKLNASTSWTSRSPTPASLPPKRKGGRQPAKTVPTKRIEVDSDDKEVDNKSSETSRPPTPASLPPKKKGGLKPAKTVPTKRIEVDSDDKEVDNKSSETSRPPTPASLPPKRKGGRRPAKTVPTKRIEVDSDDKEVDDKSPQEGRKDGEEGTRASRMRKRPGWMENESYLLFQEEKEKPAKKQRISDESITWDDSAVASPTKAPITARQKAKFGAFTKPIKRSQSADRSPGLSERTGKVTITKGVRVSLGQTFYKKETTESNNNENPSSSDKSLFPDATIPSTPVKNFVLPEVPGPSSASSSTILTLLRPEDRLLTPRAKKIVHGSDSLPSSPGASRRKQDMSVARDTNDEGLRMISNNGKLERYADLAAVPVYLSQAQRDLFFAGLKPKDPAATKDNPENYHGGYYCEYCKETMSSLKEGRRHMVAHIRVMRLRCKLCGTGAFFCTDMRSHLQDRHCPELKKAPAACIRAGTPCMSKSDADTLMELVDPSNPGRVVFTSGQIISSLNKVPYFPDPVIEEKILGPSRIPGRTGTSPVKPRVSAVRRF